MREIKEPCGSDVHPAEPFLVFPDDDGPNPRRIDVCYHVARRCHGEVWTDGTYNIAIQSIALLEDPKEFGDDAWIMLLLTDRDGPVFFARKLGGLRRAGPGGLRFAEFPPGCQTMGSHEGREPGLPVMLLSFDLAAVAVMLPDGSRHVAGALTLIGKGVKPDVDDGDLRARIRAGTLPLHVVSGPDGAPRAGPPIYKIGLDEPTWGTKTDVPS